MTESSEGRLGRRLRRILLLLPYAIRHPGVSVDELARKFGVQRRELVEDLNLVFLCGLPGYGPGDLIEATLDEDRVYVRMADYFGAPLRLTPAEALALYAGGAALTTLPGMEEADSLQRGLQKLGRALGAEEGSELRVQLDTGPVDHLSVIQEALRDNRRLHLDYFSASRGELTSREIDPWGLVAAVGRWYLVAWDHSVGDERMFRTDRIKDAEMLDEPAGTPEDFDADRYKGAFVERDDEPAVTLEISPAVATWFHDYYRTRGARTLDDGWQEVRLTTSGERWPALLVLRLGPDVRNVRPANVLATAKKVANEIATRHACL